MPVRIRLQRFGRKDFPVYRMVAADSRAPRDGKFIERLGTVHPIADKHGVKEMQLNSERIKYWLSVGAQPSDRVRFVLGQADILPPMVHPVRPKKSTPKKVLREQKKGFSTLASDSAFGNLSFQRHNSPGTTQISAISLGKPLGLFVGRCN